jgi:GNAT superfamily N-acetyltransferase
MVDLRREAEEWLAQRGIDQWTSKWNTIGREKLRRATRQRRAWVVDIGTDIAAGTVTLGGPDEELWHIDDGPALYLYKMIVARRYAGCGIGSFIIEWALEQAARYGYPSLRLDTWPTNTRLLDYYKEQGFTLVRIEQIPGRDSGALFQRRADQQESGRPTSLVEQGAAVPIQAGPD